MPIKQKPKTLRGDTLVEVMFAIGIFAMVAISVSTLMNNMLGKSQSAIEIVMARSEIDAQAEALRFIHGSRKNDVMEDVWAMIADRAQLSNTIDDFFLDENYFSTHDTSCPGTTAANPLPYYAFYIDNFKLDDIDPSSIYIPSTSGIGNNIQNITPASTFPRILHNAGDDILHTYFGEDSGNSRAEGIWVVAIKDRENDPEYYDFYIQACWNSLGNSMPSTISTIVRLRNPTKLAVNPNPPAPPADDAPDTAETRALFHEDANVSSPADTIKKTGASQSISSSEITASPSKPGYTFKGWALSSSPNTVVSEYYTGSSSTSPNHYLPVFEEVKTTVVFVGHDGSTISTKQGTPGDNVTIPSAPARSGFTFLNWTNGSTTATTSIKFPQSGTATWTANYARTTIYYSISYNKWKDNDIENVTETGSLNLGDSYETSKIVCGSGSVTFNWGDNSSSLTHSVPISNPGECTGIWPFSPFSNPWKAKLTYSSAGAVTGSSSK